MLDFTQVLRKQFLMRESIFGARVIIALLVSISSVAFAGPPVLQSISFSEETADLSSGAPATIDVTLEVSSPDGISILSIFTNDSEGFFGGSSIFFSDFEGGGLQRTAGDATAGTYQGQLSFPAFRPGGEWRVFVSIDEENGDESSYSDFDIPFPSGFDGSLSVTNTGTVDVSAPEVSLFTFTPSTVDAADGDQEITVRIDATDDLGIRDLNLTLYDSDGEFVDIADIDEIDPSAGTYQATFTVPGRIAPATWLPSLTVTDLSGRTNFYGAIFGDPDFPGMSDQQLTITNSGEVNTPPVLVSLSITPDIIDVSDGAQEVTIRVEVTDDSGDIGSISISPGDFSRDIFVDLDSVNKVAPGIYETTFTFPPFLPPGNNPIEVSITDVDDAIFFYGGPFGEPIPAGSTTAYTIVNSGLVDTTPPVLTSLTFSPNPIPRDTAFPVEVTVSLTATDDLSGLREVFLGVYSAPGGEEISFEGSAIEDGSAEFVITLDALPVGDLYSTYLFLSDRSRLITEYGDAFEGLLAYLSGIPALSISDAPAVLTYAQWLTQNPSLPAGKTAFTDDPDSDTLPNGLEFALSSDPTTFTPPPAPDTSTPGMVGLTLPASRPATEAILTLQQSTDLTTWSALPSPESRIPTDPGSTPKFLRFEAALPPG